MTSSDDETLRETGIAEKTEQQVLRLAQLTAKCGLDGVVASPMETQALRENIERTDFLIVTPGIRPEFASPDSKVETSDDQKRVMTPNEAVSNGADYLVIGRPVLQAENKLKAVRQILDEIDS